MSTGSELCPKTAIAPCFLDDLQLHGFAGRTQEMYMRAVRQLAYHYHRSPDRITEEALRQYFLHIRNVKKWSRAGEAALKYLAPYIFRVAISNRRLVKLENGQLTFQYRDGQTKRFKTKTLTAEEVKFLAACCEELRQ